MKEGAVSFSKANGPAPDAEEIIVDCFAGGGGASLGIEMALGRSPDIGVNHDPEALAIHRYNHPRTTHYIEDIRDVDPVAVCAGRPVGLAWFSPDCKHHSNAKGGPPIRSKEIRALAWTVVEWARLVRPRVIILENVREFQKWGPLTKKGKIIKSRIGEEFEFWWKRLEHLGYKGEMRLLKACDLGAPTSRERLYIIWRCDGEPIVWPDPTHGPGRPLPYRTAAECIDWTIPCPSIFMTKHQAKAFTRRTGIKIRRPLAAKTMARIARGLRKYLFEAAKPFLIPVTHAGYRMDGTPRNDERVYDGTQPMPTGGGFAVAHAELVRTAHGEQDRTGKRRGQGAHSVDQPFPTICASSTDYAVTHASLIQTGYGERAGQEPRCLNIEEPLGTVVGCGTRHALVHAFMVKHFGQRVSWNEGQELDRPLGTVTTRDHHSVVATNLVNLRGTSEAHMDATAMDVQGPVPTVSAGGNHVGLVNALLTNYNGNGKDAPTSEPLHTITTKDRFSLVVIAGQVYRVEDVGMRMLRWRELARAQGFPDTYKFDVEYNGKPLADTAIVRMIGNSVCPPVACALVTANYQVRRIAIAPERTVA